MKTSNITNGVKKIPANIVKTADKTGEAVLGTLSRITKNDCFVKTNPSSAINKNTVTGFAAGAMVITLAATCVHRIGSKIKELKNRDN